MGEKEKETEVTEIAANGTSLPEKEKSDEVMTEKTGESNGVKEIEVDKTDSGKDETEKIDENQKVNEEKEGKEKKEKQEKEGEVEAMEEETEPKVSEEIEETKKETEEGVEENVGESKEKEKMVEEETSKEEVEEKVEGSKDEEEKLEEEKGNRSNQHAEGKSDGKKVERKRKVVEEKKEPEPWTPAFDRPQRERKSVERLVAVIDKDAVKEFHIEKGRGSPLKDIPNVAFKLSRRKTDDTFKLLHTILFGRRGKAFQIKSNISRFSGFVWHQNEEKQKIKVKEKFDKCNKEKLLEFCDVLDIPITKATTKKEDIVMTLIEFLEAPHATNTDLLAEKEKGKVVNKRKRGTKSSSSGSTPSKRAAKSRGKVDYDLKRADKKSTADSEDESEEEKEEEGHEEEEQELEQENAEEGNVNGSLDESETEISEHSESEERNESDEESEEDTRKRKKRSYTSSRKKGSGGKTKTKQIAMSNKSSPPPKRTPKKSSAKRFHSDEDSDGSPKAPPRMKRTEKLSKEKSLPLAKSIPKEKMVGKAGKGKEKAKVEKDKSAPSDDELRDAICEILKKVDFNTATFTDILKLLAKRFDMDLTQRKASIKLMIQEELTKLADEVDDEDGEGDAEKDETQSTGQEVEA